MRALVISGGGSKGAFAGGIAAYLISVLGYRYDLFVGTSTGSLLLPHLALNNLERLREIYTTVQADDIFDISPFKITNNRISINHWNTIRMFMRGQKSFGSSAKLRELIEAQFSKEDFIKLRQEHKEMVVSVSNLTTLEMEYKSTLKCEYEDFLDWMWASANQVPFMSVVEKDGCEYADGGFGSQIPLHEAIRRGATSIDVIVLRRENPKEKKKELSNPFDSLTRVYEFMHQQIIKDDIRIGKIEGAQKKVDIQFYFTPRKLIDNSLIFHPELMKRWWKEGYAYAGLKNKEKMDKKNRGFSSEDIDSMYD